MSIHKDLSSIAEQAMQYAKTLGMDQSEVTLNQGTGVSVSVRQQALETIEKHNDSQVVVTVYKDHKTGSASSADMSEQGIKKTVEAAASIAKFTGSDDCLGLADKALMATDLKDLDLYHPWHIDEQEMVEMALQCEHSALQYDKRITNSEGASLDKYSGTSLYANSHGFINQSKGSRHSISCSVIGSTEQGMQRDYWYDSNRNAAYLMNAKEVGETAAQRTVKRLNARKVASTEVPVLFDPSMSKSLIGHLISAIKGGVIYKKASFLLDQVGNNILPEFVTVSENPHLVGESGSSMHDKEGVATPNYRAIVADGVLQNYILGSYTSRKLNLPTTANAGGVRNIRVSHSKIEFDELVSQIDEGLLVTELIGSGINMVTGDYSRGAAGFWIENGEVQYPVEEITVAGNLKDMYQNIVAIGSDIDQRGNLHCGSILIQNLTIAGS